VTKVHTGTAFPNFQPFLRWC